MSITWQPGITLEQMEEAIILRAYKHFEENKTHTSSSLGISIRTLDNKLEKYLGKTSNERIELNNGTTLDDHRYGRARSKVSEKSEAPRVHAAAGVHVESVIENSKELSLPVQKREEVQEMPLLKHANRSASGRR